METIKKQILLNEGKDYYLNILLTSTVKDLGFFDTLYTYSYNYGYYYEIDFEGLGLENLL
jgi:hypothetical protein